MTNIVHMADYRARANGPVQCGWAQCSWCTRTWIAVNTVQLYGRFNAATTCPHCFQVTVLFPVNLDNCYTPAKV